MKVVVAPDSFKECLTARQVGDAIAAGWLEGMPGATVEVVPIADGGEGTVQALVDATGGSIVPCQATGPLGEPLNAFLGVTGDGRTAVIEMAAASGLALVPQSRRDPRYTTTFGTGELILAALNRDIDQIVIGIGGSATNDGGAGMATALGAELLDSSGAPIPFGNLGLARLSHIRVTHLAARLKQVRITVACDVDNPLTGPNGASTIFGPQKGATPEMIGELDQNLRHLAAVVRSQLHREIENVAGAGAAGGLGGGLIAFCDATLRPGIEIAMDVVNLRSRIVDADLVIVGEGRTDGQTARGKAPVGVARLARGMNVPVIALAGGLGDGFEAVYGEGIDAIFLTTKGIVTLDDALMLAAESLRRTARNLAVVWDRAARSSRY